MPDTLEKFLQQLRNSPESIGFNATMALIDQLYSFNPTTFRNGALENPAGSNNGSCKLFAFAALQGLSEAETLACFGDYYRRDVLGDPQGNDHQNIRNFMRHGWKGIQLPPGILVPRASG